VATACSSSLQKGIAGSAFLGMMEAARAVAAAARRKAAGERPERAKAGRRTPVAGAGVGVVVVAEANFDANRRRKEKPQQRKAMMVVVVMAGAGGDCGGSGSGSGGALEGTGGLKPEKLLVSQDKKA
jgi:hypothetical protein